jgi:hypothetical protein
MKKIFLFSLFSFLFGAPVFVFAAATISAAIPGMTNVTTSTPPGAYVSGFYDFALMIGGVLAFGAIVYGGVLYAISMGNPSRQSEGKEWIQSALIGLLLLAGATLILKTINPDLVNLNLPTLQAINIQGSSNLPIDVSAVAAGNYNSPQETQSYAAGRLSAAGIPVVSTGNCSDQNNKNCTSLAGIRQDTIDDVVYLKSACGCTVVVSGGTETGHGVSQTQNGHTNGTKVDLQDNSSITNYIENKSGFTQIANRRDDGAVQYKDTVTGAVYAYEQSLHHWDVTVP